MQRMKEAAAQAERLGLLGQAKMLGGIGSILELIPGVSIIGYVLTLIAVKYISDSLGDRSIFNNMLFAVITGIVGVAVGVGLLVTGALFSVLSVGITAIFGVITFLAVIWIALIISALYIRRSYDTIAARLNITTFKTAGTLYFIGAILTIVLVGFVILLVAYIFQILAFFAIEETLQSPQPPHWSQASQAAPPIQPQAPAQGARFCPNCGAAVDAQAAFCKSCGRPLA